MDIQQLMTLAAAPAKASSRTGGEATGGSGAFANQLTQMAQVATAAKSAPGANSAQGARADGAAAFDASTLESLRQALGHGDMQALAQWLDDTGMAQGDAESVLQELQALLQPGGQGPASLLPTELQARIGDSETAPATAAEGNEDDEWSALRERLALIDQAGRLTEGDPAELAQAALTPMMATLSQGDGSRPLDSFKGGPEATSRAPLQHAILEAMQRAGQAQTQADGAAAPRLTTAEALGNALARQAEVPPAVTPPSQGEGGRASLLEGFSPLTANQSAKAMPAAAGQAGAPTATASLSAPVGSQAWPQQLGQQLVRMSQSGGEQRLELQLHPAELGPLSVSLKLGEQGAQAQFLSAHAQVRQVLEQALPQLREALAEQGIELGEATVGEQRSGGDGREAGEGDAPMLAGGAAIEGGEPDLEGLPDTAAGRELRLDGRVDLYA
ncbi:flagellar hook-length control protein FliK [Halomonas shengliensis]|uniref:Flagellar hook-length control protein FliK n=1 Tax=Halomonas shengliensis TaxID=419597 RepID=A0A1H0EYB5_9GAMM|nr:flagellar hook-length control protein FliK [Halomonas shengliensis]SDN87323.1 flagellar hook-length control protein FliK [Halomonas shengliensis]